MEQPHNPYAPPKADIAEAPAKSGPDVKRVFSPGQASIGTFLGGPLAGAYFIRSNFLALEKGKQVTIATVWGVVVSAAILLVLPFLPERMPGFIVPIAYSITVRVIIERAQFTKAQVAASSTLTFHSNWRVVGVAALGFLVFGVVGVGIFLLVTPI